MLFSSGIFIFLFLPIALLGYHLVSRLGRNAALLWLTASSLFFYGYWSPRYLLLLLASMLMNFLFSFKLTEANPENSRGNWLRIAIIANILLLIYYKYLFPVLNFFHDRGVLSREFSNVILPLGISFFTFTQIAYLIDLRQGIAKQQTIVPYSVFVTFFPHLIAGPIIHPRELMPQLEAEEVLGLHRDNLTLGLTWFAMGLAKKVLIADRISPLADVVFAHPAAMATSSAWLGTLCYAMQLYFDFSGYSDMALGLARMFNIRFPINFNSPFKAHGIIEFWTRWHMTLSRYLNEYLYTPVIRWRMRLRIAKGKKATMKAAGTPDGFFDMVMFPSLFTMGIAGIWHGAGLQFLVFGILHGVYLCINHAWRFLTPTGSRFHKMIPAPVLVVVNFLAVLLGLIFFRANSIHDALTLTSAMLGFQHSHTPFAADPWLDQMPPLAFFLHSAAGASAALVLCFFIVWALPNTQELLEQTPTSHVPAPSLPVASWWHPVRMSIEARAAACAVLFYFVLFLGEQPRAFLYFQF